ncbi:MAG: aldehyde dehydrogenase family protein, partial [Pseudomonadota bacterium]
INARGFGLTFALHSRIDDRVQSVAGKVRAGNTYVNRNQIGAIVGSQPFGGEGRSGTGPKAGGPHYLPRFCRAAQGQVAQDAARQTPGGTQTLNTPQRPDAPQLSGAPQTSHLPDTSDGPQTPYVPQASFQPLSDALAALPDPDGRARTGTDLPGPTGEANRLTTHPRGRVLCLGPGPAAAAAQVTAAQAVGCSALAHGGPLDPAALTDAAPLDAVLWWGDAATARRLRQALARRAGAILPLITAADPSAFLVLERHLCIDTTAAGGNATLLAAAS